MRVLFQAHHDFGRMYGGGPSVVHNLAAALIALGVEVVYHDYWTHRPADFDLVHYFGCYDLHNWLRHRPTDPPLVVTPISWFDDGWVKRAEDRLKFWLRAARHRTADRVRLGYPDGAVAHWFPNSAGEADRLARRWPIAQAAMTVVPHGVAARFAAGDPKLFETAHGVREFALCVGRFEHPRKNQLGLIQAMKGTDVPLVFVGGPEPGHEWYYERCRAEAGPAVRFVPPVPHDHPLLVSAYHAAKVVVQPAALEAPGLAGLEGAAAGANVATTTGGATREYFGDAAWYFDPNNPSEMRAAVLEAHASPRQPALRDRVLAEFTWDRIAAAQLAAYRAVVAR
jgi:glycosyltransferase involved in cell wall biosynthesis